MNPGTRYKRWLTVILGGSFMIVASCQTTPKQISAAGSQVRLSPADAEAAEPAIAASPDGEVYVAWVAHANNQADVMLSKVGRDGTPKGGAVRVNSRPGIATAWRGDPPSIAIAPDKTVFIVWTARVESESNRATDVYVSASRDQGSTFGEPVKVNDDQKPAVHGMHSVGIAKDGRVYVAWLDERNISPGPDMKMNQGTGGHHMESNREVFISSSSDGGRTFAMNKRVATNVCPCCKTALAIGNDGRVYLSWRQVLEGDYRHIAVSSSTDQGQTFSSAKIVSDDQWMIPGCPVSGASISISTDGNLRVLWYSEGKNGETGLYSAESKDGGNTFSPRTLVSRGQTRGTPVLLQNETGWAAVWEASGKVMTASLKDKSADPVTVTNGELPVAVEISANLLVAYIAKTDQRQAIFVASTKRPI